MLLETLSFVVQNDNLLKLKEQLYEATAQVYAECSVTYTHWLEKLFKYFKVCFLNGVHIVRLNYVKNLNLYVGWRQKIQLSALIKLFETLLLYIW